MARRKPKVWYHGGSEPRLSFDEQRWDRDRTTASLNAEGPGIYFTDDFAQAASYGPHILQAELGPDFKLVPNRSPTLKALRELYDLADAQDQEIFLSNWGEFVTPTEVLRKYSHQEKLHDAFVSLYGDLYRYSPTPYLSSLRAMGYDGVRVPKSYGRTHLIVWSPRKLVDVQEAVPPPGYEENPLVGRLRF